MPKIARFYGIVIKMYPRDHPPPHLHEEYAEHEFCIDLRTGEVCEGSGPTPQVQMVRQWLELHKAELAENWELVSQRMAPNKIAPLD